MSYEPTNWSAGDTVTSAKLNKIEQGIATNSSNILVVHLNDTDGVYTDILDKTWQEIHDAMPFVYIDWDHEDTHTRWLVTGVVDNGTDGAWRYQVYTNDSASRNYATSSPDSYPGTYDY